MAPLKLAGKLQFMNFFQFGWNAFLFRREPISLIHFLTGKCNARCRHCFIDFDSPGIWQDELTLPEIARMTKNFGRSLFNVNLTGGEPFLHPDIFDIVRFYAANTTVDSFVITTNGMFVDAVKNFLDQFVNSSMKARLKISVSIDDIEEAHDANRQVKGLFRNAMAVYEAVESYKDDRLMADVVITVTPYNYKNVKNLYQYLKKRGIRSCTAILMRSQGVISGLEKKEEVLDAHRKLFRLIQADQCKERPGGRKHRLQETVKNAKNIIVTGIQYKTCVTPQFVSLCTAGTLFGVIYPNGDVFPCELLDRQKIGNLRDYNMNFMALWRSRKAQEVRKFIKDTRCHCTFECVWSTNIISGLRYMPFLFIYTLRNILWQMRK